MAYVGEVGVLFYDLGRAYLFHYDIEGFVPQLLQLLRKIPLPEQFQDGFMDGKMDQLEVRVNSIKVA